MLRAAFTEPPQSASVGAELQYPDGTLDAVELVDDGSGSYEAAATVATSPGYTLVRVLATGLTTQDVSFERGEHLVFQVTSSSVAVTGVYVDEAPPRQGDASLYDALTISVGVDAAHGDQLFARAFVR